MNMMAITPKNRKVDLNTLNIVRESFEEQKGIKVLSIYSKDNDIYGVYIAPLNQLLSYSYIVCEEILKTNDKLESFEIICIFNKYLKDFTPKQAEKYAKSHKFRLF